MKEPHVALKPWVADPWSRPTLHTTLTTILQPRNPAMVFESSLIFWPQASPPTAGHIVGQQQLTSYLQKALDVGPRNVVLFLQDKMSMEDFTKYGGVFGNKQDSVFPSLEGALRAAVSPLVLPAVSWPASNAVISQLQDQLETSALYMDPETLSQLRLNASSPALLVFRLPYSAGADLMSTKDILSENDAVMGQVLNIMKTQSVPYTALYTGLQPSRVRLSLHLQGFITRLKGCLCLHNESKSHRFPKWPTKLSAPSTVNARHWIG
uniref:ATPase H+ transporting accessory protein 1 n=1 Tax=Oryzias sinensis TaxID=183150 RepID=A0A8C7ZS87_9TELE